MTFTRGLRNFGSALTSGSALRNLNSLPTSRKISVTAQLAGATVMIVGAFSANRQDDHITGPAWAIGLFAAGAVLAAAGNAYDAIVCRRLFAGVYAVALLFVAFTVATPHSNVDRPFWLAAMAVLILILLLAGGVPMLVLLWHRGRDERARAMIGAAASIAFGVTLLTVAGFAILDQFSTVDLRLTPSWVLLTAAASMTGSTFVLRGRM